MKTLFYFLILALVTGCSTGKKELYGITDSFVGSLQKIYDVYGILDSTGRIKTTNDNQYQVMPVGRLINVKILKIVSDDIYKELKEDLENYYKDDKRVNNVYINKAGTIVIDCRN